MRKSWEIKCGKYACFLLAAVFGYLEVFKVELTNDTNYFMHCALRLWRFGAAQLYDRCVDENAPFHIVFYAPLAGLAVRMHTEPSYILHGTCFILCLCSLAVLWRVLRCHGIENEECDVWMAITAFALLVAPSFYGVFADREHFLFIFALPWLVQMMLNLRPQGYTIALAAFGFCMKPHDFVLFAVMVLAGGPKEWSLRQRIFSSSVWCVGGFALVYAALTWVFFPQFMRDILPLSLIVYPSKYYSFAYKFDYAIKYIIIALISVLTFVTPVRAMVSWTAFIAGCAAVLFLNAGWDYTFYLACVPMLLACATPWLPRYRKKTDADRRMIKTVRIFLVLILALCVFSICTEMGVLKSLRFRNHNSVNPGLRAALQQAGGDKFILLSVNVWNTQIEPFGGKPEAVFGYDNPWTYRWLNDNPGDSHHQEIMDRLTSSFAKALTDNPGAVVIEDISPKPKVAPEGIVAFLKQDAKVRDAMYSYTRVQAIDFCLDWETVACRFVIWRPVSAKNP